MKILIIKPSSFGDIIHGLLIAQSIKGQCPDAEITWVVREIFEPLVSNCKAIDRTLIFYRKRGVRGFLKLAQDVRRERYDWVLDFQGLARSALLMLAAKSRHKIVRSDAREFSGFGLWQRAPLPVKGRKSHAVEILLKFLGEMGLREELCLPLLFKRCNKGMSFRESSLKTVLLFPNSRRPEKEWKGFFDLTKSIIKNRSDLRVIWLGQTEIEADPAWPEDRFTNLIGKTSIEELISWVQNASLIIANDSGPMHLAAALEKPLIAIFGPTEPELYGPYPLSSMRNQVVASVDNLVSSISVSQVSDTVRQILE